jgi:vancomycin aglycone glucosyltransferase
MRITIVAGGTRGDVQPMLALALELARRGHDLLLAAAPNFGAWVSEHNVPFHPTGRNPQEFLAEHGLDMGKAFRALKEDLRGEFASLAEPCAGADLVLGASATCAGRSHAERRGVPYLYAVFSPSLLSSRQHPAPTCRFLGLPRWMNALTWWAHRRLWNTLFRRILDEERARLELGPVGDTWDHVETGPLLVGCDPALAPVPDDAAPADQPGALFLPERDALPAELERFLDAGPPPVYLGFGSMVAGDPGRGTATLLAAIRAAGVRAVIGRGWAGLGEGAAAEDVFVAGAVPHGKLFPRVAAVVHHGGSGTTANAARAGLPQLLVPHLLDQYFWGHRVAALGLGPPPIRRPRLTAGRLAAALRTLVADAGYRERARALAATLIPDGVQRAADIVERLGSRPRRAAAR